MAAVPELESLLYDESDGVAWVTLNRPDAFNAFDTTMQRELRELWFRLRSDDDVRCIVLTGAGDKAFCTGLDRESIGSIEDLPPGKLPGYHTPWDFDDPGKSVCPKTNELWKPVIAAVNGMACGGAFYILGEVDFIIAADHATFFDPHVTYGMPAAFEPIFLLHKMPFQEVMRLSLLGAHERMSAKRAHEIGFVSEVVPGAELARADRVGRRRPSRTNRPSRSPARSAPSGPVSSSHAVRPSTTPSSSPTSAPTAAAGRGAGAVLLRQADRLAPPLRRVSPRAVAGRPRWSLSRGTARIPRDRSADRSHSTYSRRTARRPRTRSRR